jgi:hypothetical protein
MLILEDVTRHRMLDAKKRSKALQTVCMLLVLFSLVGVLAHELAHHVAISAALSQQMQQSSQPHSTATPDLHPNAQTP